VKKIKLDQLEPGMQLSRPAIAATGVILLEAGAFLNSETIEKLKQWEIDAISIIDTSAEDILAEKLEQRLKEEFKISHMRAMDFTREFIAKVALGETPDDTDIQKLVLELIDKLLTKSDILFMLTGLYSVDNYIYAHAVNTAVLALIIGMKKEMDRETLLDLGAAALLADVGMSLIPSSVYTHDGPLTPEQRDIIRRHTEHGVTILSRPPKFKQAIIDAVAQHHERIDGSGYPGKLKAEEISGFARIIAVSDVYAAVREPRAHREQSPPRRALKAITSDHGFDPEILRTVFATLSIYPVQSIIRLNNGFVGTVIGVTENNPFRPIIRLTTDQSGNPVKSSRIDLSKPANKSLFIEEVLDS
jgi:HD-GYP domain-containing protein (c-di-GMP phosphodiesterase class II)